MDRPRVWTHLSRLTLLAGLRLLIYLSASQGLPFCGHLRMNCPLWGLLAQALGWAPPPDPSPSQPQVGPGNGSPSKCLERPAEAEGPWGLREQTLQGPAGLTKTRAEDPVGSYYVQVSTCVIANTPHPYPARGPAVLSPGTLTTETASPSPNVTQLARYSHLPSCQQC